MIHIDVLSLGLACPLGLTALEAYAALDANLRSIYRDPEAEALVEQEGEANVRASRTLALPPGTSRRGRAAFYAQPALVDAMRPFDPRQPGGQRGAALYLATPEPRDVAGYEVRGLIGELASMFRKAEFFPQGRAGMIGALEAACGALERGEFSIAVVGGADSLADTTTLARLAREGRLLGDHNPDGMIPGEGAAFVVLGRDGMAPPNQPPLARLGPLVRGREREPRASGANPQAEGLSAVFAALARQHPRRVDVLHAAQTGQNYWARELSFAAARRDDLMPAPMQLRRRAEALGELGAAAGAIAFATAVLDFHALVPDRPRAVPLPKRGLVYACADAGELGACLLFSRPLHLLQ